MFPAGRCVRLCRRYSGRERKPRDGLWFAPCTSGRYPSESRKPPQLRRSHPISSAGIIISADADHCCGLGQHMGPTDGAQQYYLRFGEFGASERRVAGMLDPPRRSASMQRRARFWWPHRSWLPTAVTLAWECQCSYCIMILKIVF